MQIKVGPITFTKEELLNFGKAALNKVKRWRSQDGPFKNIDESKVNVALANAVAFLILDRWDDGIGAGGWGRTDRRYMRDLYGETIAREGPLDSVMTTVAVALALQSYRNLIKHSDARGANKFYSEGWEVINTGLTFYTKERWKELVGYGGTVRPDKEGQLKIIPSYRHTGWLLGLWLSLNDTHKSLKTITCLIKVFDEVNWEKEKVATPVAVHSALHMALKYPSIVATIGGGQIKLLMKQLEGKIYGEYKFDIEGWTSKGAIDQNYGRQIYTPFVLAELAHTYQDNESPLLNQMSEALSKTLSEEWKGKFFKDIPLMPGTHPELNISCLTASALLRKPINNQEDNRKVTKLIDYLITHLNSDLSKYNPYAWSLSYFVKDVCDYYCHKGNV